MCASCGCKDVNDVMIPGNNAKNGYIPNQKVEHRTDMSYKYKAVPMEKAKNKK